MEGGESLGSGSGLQIRDWLFVDDHVKALLKVAIGGRVGETYNIGSKQNLKKYNKVLKSTDTEEKWAFAQAALDSNECFKALPLLEELVGLTRGTQRAETVQYKYAEAHYCVNDFYLARYYFTTYAKTFPNSHLVEEVEFKSAICSYNLSPNWSLDQTETKSAIQELQLFMDKYPGSALRDSSQTMIDQLRGKLEKKSFELMIVV